MDESGNQVGLGSGVMVAPRLVMTSGHLISGQAKWIVTSSDGKTKVSGSKAMTYDWMTYDSDLAHPRKHDVGVIYLDDSIKLDKYPTVLSDVAPAGSTAIRLRGTGSSFQASPTQLARMSGIPNSYLTDWNASETLDTGAAVFNEQGILGIVSGIGTTTNKLYIARTDGLTQWLSSKIACAGGALGTRTYAPAAPKEQVCDDAGTPSASSSSSSGDNPGSPPASSSSGAPSGGSNPPGSNPPDNGGSCDDNDHDGHCHGDRCSSGGSDNSHGDNPPPPSTSSSSSSGSTTPPSSSSSSGDVPPPSTSSSSSSSSSSGDVPPPSSSSGDNGNKGPKGNNGVGNGVDGQPPGNPPINDAPGTGPGNPGNKGGSGGKSDEPCSGPNDNPDVCPPEADGCTGPNCGGGNTDDHIDFGMCGCKGKGHNDDGHIYLK
jgi:hypothetical protein